MIHNWFVQDDDFWNPSTTILRDFETKMEYLAREISDLSKIPRTKVYDVLKRLADKGFVEIQPRNPTLLKASEPLEVSGTILRDTVNRVKDAENVKIEKRRVQLVWVSRDRFTVESRIREVVNWAKHELLKRLVDR
ncbi:MAG: hypothetical protein DRP01_07805, partial [Archaeoglobales archaeon]